MWFLDSWHNRVGQCHQDHSPRSLDLGKPCSFTSYAMAACMRGHKILLPSSSPSPSSTSSFFYRADHTSHGTDPLEMLWWYVWRRTLSTFSSHLFSKSVLHKIERIQDHHLHHLPTFALIQHAAGTSRLGFAVKVAVLCPGIFRSYPHFRRRSFNVWPWMFFEHCGFRKTLEPLKWYHSFFSSLLGVTE